MTLTADEVRSLPAVLDLPTAARLLGVGKTNAYELVRSGHWPTPVLRIGKLIRVPTAPLVELLGLERLQDDKSKESGVVAGGRR